MFRRKLRSYETKNALRESHCGGDEDGAGAPRRRRRILRGRILFYYCSGQRGVRILYDTFFKEILDPNTTPERVEELLSLILKQKVKILKVLPLESPRLGDEQSLIVMDVVVELEDHSIANLEVQKAGYYFPGQRAACYSSDLLLRQYRRVREDLEKQEKRFSYREIKKVYTIHPV